MHRSSPWLPEWLLSNSYEAMQWEKPKHSSGCKLIACLWAKPHTPFWLLLPSLHIPSQMSCLRFLWKILRKAIFLNNNPAYPLCSPRSTPSFGFVVVVDVCLFPFSLWFGRPSRSIPSCPYCLQLGETRVETKDRSVLVCGSLLSRHFFSSSFSCVSLQPFSLRSQCLQ